MKKTMLLLIAVIFSLVAFAQEKKITELKISQLPKETTKFIKTNISGGKITRAGKVEENGITSYVAVVETQGQKHVYLFDKNGKFSGKGDHLAKGKGQPADAKTDPKQAAPATPKK